MAASPAVGELLGRHLAAAGVSRVFGDALPGLAHVAVDEPSVAALLADADGRLGPGPGAALLPGPLLRLSCRPGDDPQPVPVRVAADIPAVVARAADVATTPGTAAIALELDLGEPAPDAGPVTVEDPVGEPPPIEAIGSVVVLAGPGVVRAAMAPALRDLAAVGNLGVVNTWGAKGLFDWQSPHHLGTAGLQERDFELCGFADAALIVACGIDVDEAPRHRWALGPVLDLPVRQLPAAAAAWTRPPAPIVPTELFGRLAAVVQPLYRSDAVPLSPGRIVADLAAAGLDLVSADPGPAGFWVARAFPTAALGSVVVPATRADGIAAALALVAGIRRPGCRAVAVTAGPVTAATASVLDQARRLRVPVVVEAWGADGDLVAAADHLDALREAVARGETRVLHVPVDLSQTAALVDVAGEIVAWSSGERAPEPRE